MQDTIYYRNLSDKPISASAAEPVETYNSVTLLKQLRFIAPETPAFIVIKLNQVKISCIYNTCLSSIQ